MKNTHTSLQFSLPNKGVQRLLFVCLRWLTIRLPWPEYARNILMWPLTSRLLPKNATVSVQRKGYDIEVGLEDQLNRLLLFFGATLPALWEPQTTKVAKYLVQHVRNSVVAGSHIGFMNLELLSSLPPNGAIYTFEPVHYLYERSKRNIERNRGEARIHLFPLALSDRDGSADIHVDSLRSSLVIGSQDKASEHITTVTLDHFATEKKIPHIDFLFLDVEGYEYHVLRGAADILEKDKPLIIFEVYPGGLRSMHIDMDDICRFLKTKGYALYSIDDNYELRKLRGWESRPVKLLPLDAYAIGSYCNVIALQQKHFDLIPPSWLAT